MRRGSAAAGLALTLMLVLGTAIPSQAARPRTRLVSIASSGAAADDESSSFGGAISNDGRRMAFSSRADALGGDPAYQNVFVRNLKTRKTILVSKTSAGVPANGHTGDDPAISGNGRFVAFASGAANLPAGDGSTSRCYLHDLKTRKTLLVGKTSGGVPSDGDCERLSLSGNGRHVAFIADADNLPGTDGIPDAYVHDRKTRKTRLVSKSSSGAPADARTWNVVIAAEGRFVAFNSQASNLGGTPPFINVYVHELKTRKTRLVSRNSRGAALNAGSWLAQRGISADGRFIAFDSQATNLPGDNAHLNVYVRDMKGRKTRLVSKASSGAPATGADSERASISSNGRYVVFDSAATNLPGPSSLLRVFVHDLKSGKTRLISRASSGAAADDSSFYGTISGDGRSVVFTSRADNLSDQDDDSVSNVFVRGPLH